MSFSAFSGNNDLNRGRFYYFIFIMLTALLGKKVRQTKIYTDDGMRIPVTEIEVGPCVVVQIKTKDRDGYSAIQLGFGHQIRKTNQPITGHLKKTGQGNYLPRFLREVRLTLTDNSQDKLAKVGDQIRVEQVFSNGDRVKVTGISKGKGFAGVVKRHGFSGGPRTHGQSDRERAPGSIGQSTTPGRVYKGKRMGGRMGNQRITVAGLKVIKVVPESNRAFVKGLIPGSLNNLVIITKT